MKINPLFLRILWVYMVSCAGWISFPASAAQTIHVVEWLPFYSHDRIIQILQEDTVTPIQRLNAYGDKKELIKQLQTIDSSDATVLVSFGNFATQSALEQCPDIPLIALFVESPDALKETLQKRSSPFVLINSMAKPEQYFSTIKLLSPETDHIGVIHTDKFSPNEQLVQRITEKAPKKGLNVTQIRVDPGFCRTDSDFEKVIRNTYLEKSIDVLLVPKDPNCDRFGHTIYKVAKELGILCIGSESTIGKGCIAGFSPDLTQLASAITKAQRSLDDMKKGVVHIHVPPKLIYDKSIAAEAPLKNNTGKHPE